MPIGSNLEMMHDLSRPDQRYLVKQSFVFENATRLEDVNDTVSTGEARIGRT